MSISPESRAYKQPGNPVPGQQRPLCTGREGNLRMALTENCKKIRSIMLNFAFPFSPCVTSGSQLCSPGIISAYKGGGTRWSRWLDAVITKRVLSTYYLQNCSIQSRYRSKQNEQNPRNFYYNRRTNPSKPLSFKILWPSKVYIIIHSTMHDVQRNWLEI